VQKANTTTRRLSRFLGWTTQEERKSKEERVDAENEPSSRLAFRTFAQSRFQNQQARPCKLCKAFVDVETFDEKIDGYGMKGRVARLGGKRLMTDDVRRRIRASPPNDGRSRTRQVLVVGLGFFL
jgi:hypothetical protein